MSKADEARQWALSRVGCPYVYGGTGKTCTVSYREARAAQYPQYADKIRKNCPRLSDWRVSDCAKCKWADPETGKGRLCYDCAQLVRYCMQAVGIGMVSGANSQWTQTKWARKGTIDSIPRGWLCVVYRQDADGKKHHTGLYLGDGYIVHAKGHDYGVLREALGGPRFTNWAIPEGLYTEDELAAIDAAMAIQEADSASAEPPVQAAEGGQETSTSGAGKPQSGAGGAEVSMRKIQFGSTGQAVETAQELLNKLGYDLQVDGKFGQLTRAAVRDFQRQNGLTADGVIGDKTWRKLLDTETAALASQAYLEAQNSDGQLAQLAALKNTLEDALNLVKAMADAINKGV